MFKSYEFTYAGMPASMFGMYIADMLPLSARTLMTALCLQARL